MSEVELDTKAFHRRAKRLLDSWQSNGLSDSKGSNVDTVLLLQGRSDEANSYTKTIATQMWLLGYEFPNTLMLFTKSKLYIIASPKKAKILQPLQNAAGGVPIEILIHGKDVAKNQAVFDKMIGTIQEAGQSVGVVAKDTSSGKLVDEWNAAFEPSKGSMAMVDISNGLSRVLALKEEGELQYEKTAASICSTVMQDFFVEDMANTFDLEKKVTNVKMSERIAGVLTNDKLAKRLFSKVKMMDMVEWSTDPVVQSGGRYDFSPSGTSDSAQLHAGTVVCTLSMRYFMYSASISRTFLVDPTPEQEKNYGLLLTLQKQMLGWVKPGVTMSTIYSQAAAYVREHRPDLADNFVKHCGHVTGIEMSDGTNTISAACSEVVEANMVLTLRVGLENMTNPKAKDSQSRTYAYQLVDTVVVKESGAELLTTCSKEPNDVLFFFNDEESAPAAKKEAKQEKSSASGAANRRAPATRTSAILPSKFRSEEKEEESSMRKRREHQKELIAKLLVDGRRRFAGDEGDDGEEKQVIKKFESYKRETALPREAQSCRIIVDERADTIILPIYGMAVPFHISALKNISKNDEGEYVYLRLNMVSPGQGVGKKENLPTDDPTATFVRSLTFRSTDAVRMAEIFHSIQSLKRGQIKRETEKAQMADIIQQDRLVPITGRRPVRLPDVFMRPVVDGKRFPSALEIHNNGLRYLSTGRHNNATIDILFNNVRHLFFQPCDNELLVLIHVHLKNPIMLGKKKMQDIQFYREASDASFDETGNRRRRFRYGDEDEIEAEQEERRRRRQLNKEFKEFAAKIAEASNHEVVVDTPFREVGFNGVPARANVFLQPTVDCLVHLSDTPFFIVT
ncbi:FACT complex subunit spt16, partial [Linderina macrospora]